MQCFWLLKISLCVNEACNIITNYLGPVFIKYPIAQGEVQSAIDGFLQKFDFSQVVGCIYRKCTRLLLIQNEVYH